MNDPTKQPVDIEDQRRWLATHRQSTSASWSVLEKRIGISKGTLSQFGSEKGYNGDEGRIAEAIARFRHWLAAQSRLNLEMPAIPGYFETETSRELCNLLNWAQQGEIVVAALGPGCGKSQSAKHYSQLYSNVILVEMDRSISSPIDMLVVVLAALGVKNAKGTALSLSMQVKAKLRALRNPLLIIDESQHLGEKSFEIIRSWNDTIGVGIAFFGDENLLEQLGGVRRKLGMAQLISRVGFRIVRSFPLAVDIDALANAWEVTDPKTVKLLRDICMKRGGLRAGTKSLRLARMLALAQGAELALDHLQDAWAQLSTQGVAA